MTAYNTRSPAVKRLMREAQELSQPTELYYAQPLEDNLFEWHFTIRGPEGSEFEGGIYHGQISLPTEYPMKPPNIMLLTPNGRFEQYRQICLSISGYHPETWCPSWSIRTALLAIIGFMPTSGAGAIGSMSVSAEERRKLATSSRNFICDICGPTRDLLLPVTSASSSTAKEAKELASQFIITDPGAPKETPSASQDAEIQPKVQNPKNNVNGGIPSAFPPQLSALQGMPRPAYWLCYPVFLSNKTTSLKAPETAAGDVKREPPLSFEEWLKKVHECPSASDGAGFKSSPATTCKSPSAKPPNLSTDQVRVNAVAASESSAETEGTEVVSQTVPEPELSEKLEAEEAEVLEEPSGCRPASSSPPTTIVLDDTVRLPVSGAESGSLGSSVAVCYSGGGSGSRRSSPGPERSGPTASLHCESPMPVERTFSMPNGPLPQYASSSVTQGPRVVPLPSKEVAKEAAQRILKDAAERHRQRVCAMQARLERTSAGGTVAAGTSLLQQQTQRVKWVAVAVATVLIALLVRRLMIMSTTGPY